MMFTYVPVEPELTCFSECSIILEDNEEEVNRWGYGMLRNEYLFFERGEFVNLFLLSNPFAYV